MHQAFIGFAADNWVKINICAMVCPVIWLWELSDDSVQVLYNSYTSEENYIERLSQDCLGFCRSE